MAPRPKSSRQPSAAPTPATMLNCAVAAEHLDELGDLAGSEPEAGMPSAGRGEAWRVLAANHHLTGDWLKNDTITVRKGARTAWPGVGSWCWSGPRTATRWAMTLRSPLPRG
jgi:hypothetical protein